LLVVFFTEQGHVRLHAAEQFAEMLVEANAMLESGTSMDSLNEDLQTVYLLSNAPSYDFLYSLDVTGLTLLK